VLLVLALRTAVASGDSWSSLLSVSNCCRRKPITTKGIELVLLFELDACEFIYAYFIVLNNYLELLCINATAPGAKMLGMGTCSAIRRSSIY
jgi:hypothetical protein